MRMPSVGQRRGTCPAVWGWSGRYHRLTINRCESPTHTTTSRREHDYVQASVCHLAGAAVGGCRRSGGQRPTHGAHGGNLLGPTHIPRGRGWSGYPGALNAGPNPSSLSRQRSVVQAQLEDLKAAGLVADFQLLPGRSLLTFTGSREALRRLREKGLVQASGLGAPDTATLAASNSLIDEWIASQGNHHP